MIETVSCDMCGRDATHDHPDVSFAWQGVTYSVDLCDSCYATTQTTLIPLVRVAERADVRQSRLNRLRRLYNAPSAQVRRCDVFEPARAVPAPAGGQFARP